MRIRELKYEDWKKVFAHQLAWAKQTPAERMSGEPYWDDHGLNVLAVRMNANTDFYLRGKDDFNDFLIFAQDGKVTVFECTTDPAHTNENPKGVAHLAEGCWDAYVRGSHKSPWRTALVQRKAPVVVYRTDHQGRIKMMDRGYFGINVHNAAGFGKPSAGCTVLKPHARILGMGDRNFKVFRKMLKAAPDRDSRTYTLINHRQMANYGYRLEEAQ